MVAKLMATNRGRLFVVAGFFVLCGLFGLGLGVLESVGVTHFSAQKSLVWLFLPLAAIFAAFAFWFGAVWMKSIDEAAQEAHKWSWYWGGSAGMAVAVLFYALHYLPESAQWEVPTLTGRADPISYAVAGGAFVVLLMVLGYLIAWGIWWFKRR